MNSKNSLKNKPRMTTKEIAFSGIFLIFILILVFLAGTLSNIQMICYFLSSLILILVINQGNIVTGITFYVASSLLCLLILPNKLAVIPYLLFFGHYGLWFYLYQSHNQKLCFYILHFFINNLCIGILYIFFHDLFINLKITSTAVFIPAVEIFLLLYHYMYAKSNSYIQSFLRNLP